MLDLYLQHPNETPENIATMVLDIYLDPCTINSRKVLSGLDMMGTKYDFHHIDYFKGEHKGEEFMKINPHATVPAARDGDLSLTESNSILMYAADLDGENKAYPKDLKARADCNRWLLWEASVWFQTNYVYVVEYVVKPLLGAQPDESIIEKEAPKWHKAAGILDARLAKNKFILGNDPSIADIAIAAPMHMPEASRLPLDQHKNLSRWYKDIQQIPAWSKHQAAVDKALTPNKQVRAEFNYTKDLGDKLTEIYFYEDPKSVDIHEPGDDPRTMTVTNGWDRVKEFDVDKNGFAMKEFHSSFDYKKQWEDTDLVREKFYPEVVEFLKKELGAKRVLVFDHTIRTKGNANKPLTDEKATSQRAPVRLVHCDYTAESGPVRVKQLLPEEADDLLSRRTAFVNVWVSLLVYRRCLVGTSLTYGRNPSTK